MREYARPKKGGLRHTWSPAFWLRVCIVRGAAVAPDPAWSGAPAFDFPPVALGGILEEG